MANHFRILFDAWSATPKPLYAFLGGLIADGWSTHLRVPTRSRLADQDGDRTILSELDAWGGYLLPDMRILTAAGLLEINEPGRNLPRFSAVSIDDRKTLVRHAGHPGLIGPAPNDQMFSVIAESRAGIPFKWFVHVIDKYYDDGLRFFVLAYDHVNASYGSADGVLFYSVPSDYEYDLDKLDGRSEHAIGLTVPDYIRSSPSPDEESRHNEHEERSGEDANA